MTGTRDAGHAPDLGREHAGRIHHRLRFHPALVGLDGAHLTSHHLDPRHPGVRGDPGAALPGTRRQGHGQAGGVEVPIGGQPGGAQHAIGRHQRESVLRFGWTDELHGQPVRLGPARLPAQLLHPLRRGGQPQRADLAPARVDAGLGRQAAVGGDAVDHHPGQGRAAAQLPHQAGGVEGGAAGQLGAFQQQDVLAAQAGQVVRDRRATHAATDDHDPRPIGQGAGVSHPPHPAGRARSQAWTRSPGAARSARPRRPRNRNPGC